MFAAAVLLVLPKASGERGLLLVGLELRQQESMADADLLGIEGIDYRHRQFGKFDTGGDIGRSLACLCGDLFDAVPRLVQIEKSAKALRLFERPDSSNASTTRARKGGFSIER